MPSIDVIVPNYQYGRYLPDCLQSVLSQDVQGLRVIVIDNASTDDSVQIVRSIAASDPRVHLVEHEVNVGHTASINEGIDLAEADYLVILCSDDLLVSGSLARAISIMEKYPDVSVAHGKARLLGGRDLALRKELPEGATPNWTISAGTNFIERVCRYPMQHSIGFMLVRTAAQKRAGHYRKELKFTNDLEMLLRLASIGNIAETDTVQGIRREHEANISSAYWNDFMAILLAVHSAVDTFVTSEIHNERLSERLRSRARANIGSHAYWSAVSHLVRGKMCKALALFRLAFGFSPRLVVVPPIGQLLTMERGLPRIWEIFSEAVKKTERPRPL
jgi:glycosyltransferase involved in cell wall biosynthesis